MAADAPAPRTAALLIIGNEILSGRTADANLNPTALKLSAIGIPLREVRVVPDVTDAIVAALDALRTAYTYVFTTGGIGPTHDDITVDAVAQAFGVDVVEDAEARARLLAHYGAADLSPARLRMARVPRGASLVTNPISTAPGIQIGNTYVLAGVPNIMQAMLDGIIATLTPGPAIHSRSASGFVAESLIAEDLAAIAARHPAIDIGSYPWVRDGKFGTALVARGTDLAQLDQAADELAGLIAGKGVAVTRSAD